MNLQHYLFIIFFLFRSLCVFFTGGATIQIHQHPALTQTVEETQGLPSISLLVFALLSTFVPLFFVESSCSLIDKSLAEFLANGDYFAA